MGKRAMALVCCLLMALQLSLVPARAAEEEVYFVAAGIDILPLSEGTMPFWAGGYLYIPASIFSGAVREALGIEFIYVEASKIAIMSDKFGSGDRILLFGMGENHAVDGTGAISYPGAQWRNGKVYVPAALVAKTFGMQYSVTEVDHGYLVWIRKPDFGLSDKNFANAASYSMATRYNEYLKSRKPAETPGRIGRRRRTCPPASGCTSVWRRERTRRCCWTPWTAMTRGRPSSPRRNTWRTTGSCCGA